MQSSEQQQAATDASPEGWQLQDDGYYVDLTNVSEPSAAIAVRAFIGLLKELWTFLEQPTTQAQAKRALITFQLGSLCTEYIAEMNRCIEGKAYFAQAVIGCSIAECLMMLLCLKERERLVQTRPWRRFAYRQRKHGKLFVELLPWVDLNELISFGEVLGWFAVDANSLAAFTASPDFEKAPHLLKVGAREAIGRLQNLRNAVHPGSSLRRRTAIDEKSAKDGAVLMLLSLAGFFVTAEGERMQSVKLPIHPALIPMLRTVAAPLHGSAGLLEVAVRMLPATGAE